MSNTLQGVERLWSTQRHVSTDRPWRLLAMRQSNHLVFDFLDFGGSASSSFLSVFLFFLPPLAPFSFFSFSFLSLSFFSFLSFPASASFFSKYFFLFLGRDGTWLKKCRIQIKSQYRNRGVTGQSGFYYWNLLASFSSQQPRPLSTLAIQDKLQPLASAVCSL